MPHHDDIALNYDPGFQALITTAGWGFLLCAVIFASQLGLIISQIPLFRAGVDGDWAAFLTMLHARPWPFLVIKANFVVMRTLFALTVLGYGAAMWRTHKSACLAMAGFAVASLPVAQICQIIELQLIPLAHLFAATTDPIARATIQLQAATLYGIGERTDVFITLVGFNGLLAAWFLIACRPPTPPGLKWWIPPMMLLPLGRICGWPAAGLFNALVTTFFFLQVSTLLRRARPLTAS